MSNGQGSLGNIIAALCSLFIPGLGQLIQGRLGSALGWFLFACLAFLLTWILTLSLLPFGWFVVSIFACVNAALYRAPGAAHQA
jgi:TM2 domain-containing membrane protein YozV